MKDAPLFLSLSCSSKIGSASFIKHNSVVETITWESERSHAEFVTPKIQQLLNNHSVELKNLDFFCIDVGPGSFTGIRIGVNTVRALGFALQKPIFTATSLDILASAVQQNKSPLCVVFDAFANSVYASFYEFISGQWNTPRPPQVLTITQLDQFFTEPTLVVGDGLEKYKNLFSSHLNKMVIQNESSEKFPTSDFLANFVIRNFEKLQPRLWQDIEPFYIRRSSAEEKLLV